MHYLAAPYTHPDIVVCNERARYASMACGRLMQKGYSVYSPITHGHALLDHIPARLSQSHAFWMKQCFAMLKHCAVLIVLPIAGWRESRGIEMEMLLAQSLHIPIMMAQDRWMIDKGLMEDMSGQEAAENGWGLAWLH
jgi:hypothetical protein